MATASPPPFITITAHGEDNPRQINVARVVQVTAWNGPGNGPSVDGAALYIDDGRSYGTIVKTDTSVADVLALLNPA